MAEKPLPERTATDAGMKSVPSRREVERDTLPMDLARKSAAGAAGGGAEPPPAPRSPLRRIAGDLASSVRAWAAGTFTREQLVAAMKSLAWVAPLTLLIWVYAEREQLHTVPSVTIPIEVVHSDPSRVVTVLDPSDSHLLVTIRGPRGEVEAVQEQFRDNASPVPIELERDVDTGELTIRAERVGMDRRFTERGVTVSNAQPGALRVRVDSVVEHEVDVQPRMPLPAGYQVKFVPPTVKMKLPAPALNVAIVERRLVAQVDLTANHPDLVDARREGKSAVTIKDLPLTLAIENKHAKLVDVKSVTAEVTFKAQSERSLTFVPVYPAARDEVTSKYEIIVPATVPGGVVVVGPEDQLEKLADPTVRQPPAFFPVTVDDAKDALLKGEAGKSAPLYFNFPEGVKVKPGAPPPSITYKVKQRAG
jgi:hypothetical protein